MMDKTAAQNLCNLQNHVRSMLNTFPRLYLRTVINRIVAGQTNITLELRQQLVDALAKMRDDMDTLVDVCVEIEQNRETAIQSRHR